MNIGLFIEILLTVSLVYGAGYLHGKNKGIEEAVEDIVHESSSTIKKVMPHKTVNPGVIRRPTARELINRNEPIKIKQAKEAMKESLDEIPELQEHKRLVQEYNKSVRGIYD